MTTGITSGNLPNSTTKSPEKNEASTTTLHNIRDLILILAGYLYFIGWIYNYNYFKHFGIPLEELQINFYSFFIYSVGVLIHPTFALVLVPMAWLIFFHFSRPMGTILHRAIVYSTISFVIFPISFYVASLSGIAQAKKEEFYLTSTLKRVYFILTDKIISDSTLLFSPLKTEDSLFRKFNEAGKLKLITASEEKYFVVYKDSTYNHYIYSVPKEIVLYSKFE